MSETKDKIILLLIVLVVVILMSWFAKIFFDKPQSITEPDNTEKTLSDEEIIALQKEELDRLQAELGPNETPLQEQEQSLNELQASSETELGSIEEQKAELDRLRDSMISN